MQAIMTKFLGPTNTRGSRYRAVCSSGSVTLAADNRWNPERNHKEAAEALVRKLGWLPSEGPGYRGLWVAGGLHNGDMCHVFVSDIDATDAFRIED